MSGAEGGGIYISPHHGRPTKVKGLSRGGQWRLIHAPSTLIDSLAGGDTPPSGTEREMGRGVFLQNEDESIVSLLLRQASGTQTAPSDVRATPCSRGRRMWLSPHGNAKAYLGHGGSRKGTFRDMNRVELCFIDSREECLRTRVVTIPGIAVERGGRRRSRGDRSGGQVETIALEDGGNAMAVLSKDGSMDSVCQLWLAGEDTTTTTGGEDIAGSELQMEDSRGAWIKVTDCFGKQNAASPAVTLASSMQFCTHPIVGDVFVIATVTNEADAGIILRTTTLRIGGSHTTEASEEEHASSLLCTSTKGRPILSWHPRGTILAIGYCDSEVGDALIVSMYTPSLSMLARIDWTSAYSVSERLPSSLASCIWIRGGRLLAILDNTGTLGLVDDVGGVEPCVCKGKAGDTAPVKAMPLSSWSSLRKPSSSHLALCTRSEGTCTYFYVLSGNDLAMTEATFTPTMPIRSADAGQRSIDTMIHDIINSAKRLVTAHGRTLRAEFRHMAQEYIRYMMAEGKYQAALLVADIAREQLAMTAPSVDPLLPSDETAISKNDAGEDMFPTILRALQNASLSEEQKTSFEKIVVSQIYAKRFPSERDRELFLRFQESLHASVDDAPVSTGNILFLLGRYDESVEYFESMGDAGLLPLICVHISQADLDTALTLLRRLWQSVKVKKSAKALEVMSEFSKLCIMSETQPEILGTEGSIRFPSPLAVSLNATEDINFDSMTAKINSEKFRLRWNKLRKDFTIHHAIGCLLLSGCRDKDVRKFEKAALFSSDAHVMSGRWKQALFLLNGVKVAVSSHKRATEEVITSLARKMEEVLRQQIDILLESSIHAGLVGDFQEITSAARVSLTGDRYWEVMRETTSKLVTALESVATVLVGLLLQSEVNDDHESKAKTSIENLLTILAVVLRPVVRQKEMREFQLSDYAGKADVDEVEGLLLRIAAAVWVFHCCENMQSMRDDSKDEHLKLSWALEILEHGDFLNAIEAQQLVFESGLRAELNLEIIQQICNKLPGGKPVPSHTRLWIEIEERAKNGGDDIAVVWDKGRETIASILSGYCDDFESLIRCMIDGEELERVDAVTTPLMRKVCQSLCSMTLSLSCNDIETLDSLSLSCVSSWIDSAVSVERIETAEGAIETYVPLADLIEKVQSELLCAELIVPGFPSVISDGVTALLQGARSAFGVATKEDIEIALQKAWNEGLKDYRALIRILTIGTEMALSLHHICLHPMKEAKVEEVPESIVSTPASPSSDTIHQESALKVELSTQTPAVDSDTTPRSPVHVAAPQSSGGQIMKEEPSTDVMDKSSEIGDSSSSLQLHIKTLTAPPQSQVVVKNDGIKGDSSGSSASDSLTEDTDSTSGNDTMASYESESVTSEDIIAKSRMEVESTYNGTRGISLIRRDNPLRNVSIRVTEGTPLLQRKMQPVREEMAPFVDDDDLNVHHEHPFDKLEDNIVSNDEASVPDVIKVIERQSESLKEISNIWNAKFDEIQRNIDEKLRNQIEMIVATQSDTLASAEAVAKANAEAVANAISQLSLFGKSGGEPATIESPNPSRKSKRSQAGSEVSEMGTIYHSVGEESFADSEKAYTSSTTSDSDDPEQEQEKEEKAKDAQNRVKSMMLRLRTNGARYYALEMLKRKNREKRNEQQSRFSRVRLTELQKSRQETASQLATHLKAENRKKSNTRETIPRYSSVISHFEPTAAKINPENAPKSSTEPPELPTEDVSTAPTSEAGVGAEEEIFALQNDEGEKMSPMQAPLIDEEEVDTDKVRDDSELLGAAESSISLETEQSSMEHTAAEVFEKLPEIEEEEAQREIFLDPFLTLLDQVESSRIDSAFQGISRNKEFIDRGQIGRLFRLVIPYLSIPSLHYCQAMLDIDHDSSITREGLVQSIRDGANAAKATRAQRHAGVWEAISMLSSLIRGNESVAIKQLGKAAKNNKAMMGRRLVQWLDMMMPSAKARVKRYLMAVFHMSGVCVLPGDLDADSLLESITYALLPAEERRNRDVPSALQVEALEAVKQRSEIKILESAAATTIQAVYRGSIGRRRAKMKLFESRQVTAAITIQKTYRGWKSRRQFLIRVQGPDDVVDSVVLMDDLTLKDMTALSDEEDSIETSTPIQMQRTVSIAIDTESIPSITDEIRPSSETITSLPKTESAQDTPLEVGTDNLQTFVLGTETMNDEEAADVQQHDDSSHIRPEAAAAETQTEVSPVEQKEMLTAGTQTREETYAGAVPEQYAPIIEADVRGTDIATDIVGNPLLGNFLHVADISLDDIHTEMILQKIDLSPDLELDTSFVVEEKVPRQRQSKGKHDDNENSNTSSRSSSNAETRRDFGLFSEGINLQFSNLSTRLALETASMASTVSGVQNELSNALRKSIEIQKSNEMRRKEVEAVEQRQKAEIQMRHRRAIESVLEEMNAGLKDVESMADEVECEIAGTQRYVRGMQPDVEEKLMQHLLRPGINEMEASAMKTAGNPILIFEPNVSRK